MSSRAVLLPGDDRRALHRARAGTEGSALVIVLLTVALLSVVVATMVLLAMADTLAVTSQRHATLTLYAAEAGIERVLPDLMRLAEWDGVLSGMSQSSFADGPPSGPRPLADGRPVDPDRVANMANCGLPSPCPESGIDAVTSERPWGRNNPRWRPFGYGAAGTGAAGSDPYVVVLAADDPAETDGDRDRDGRWPGAPGAGVILLRAEAFGPGGAHRIVEATVARSAAGSAGGAGVAALRLISWKEVR